MPANLRQIYQLKITLQGIEPEIWRRVLIPSSITLPKLHTVLQYAMGWTNSHLHQFIDGGDFYSTPSTDLEELNIKDGHRVKVSKLLANEGDRIIYEYDFGDSWIHSVVLESILPFDPDKRLPVCLDGDRSCPPEDCGGIGGYQNLLDIITDPDHPEFEEMSEWLGNEFGAEFFDAKKTSGQLLKHTKC